MEEKKAESQRRAETLRRLYNPLLRRVTERNRAISKLVCPTCGKGDKGNRMDQKPWCFNCNVPLVKPNQVKRWMKVKVLKKGLDDDTLRKIRGLPDDGGITY